MNTDKNGKNDMDTNVIVSFIGALGGNFGICHKSVQLRKFS